MSQPPRSPGSAAPRIPPARAPVKTRFSSSTIVLSAFFLSGLAGVMHEVVWSRQLVVLLGAETYAQAVVLAVFMGGLAVGAVVLGGRADRGRPLSLYITLELLVAAYAL